MPELSESLLRIAVLAVPFLLAVICHEVAHGLAALAFGDPTARDAGRLTLNPIRHLDKAGTLVFVFTALFTPFVFGWAKPVPITPYRFRHLRAGLVVVSAAGAAANFLLAALLYPLFSFLVHLPPAEGPVFGFFHEWLVNLAMYGVAVNIIIGAFNLLPIPPLDGSNILAALLPRSWAARYSRIGRYGMIILILLMASGAFGTLFRPLLQFINSILSQA
ncbi:MAG: site-2 protease family protein [Thermodesulfobacteriota bacterium]